MAARYQQENHVTRYRRHAALFSAPMSCALIFSGDVYVTMKITSLTCKFHLIRRCDLLIKYHYYIIKILYWLKYSTPKLNCICLSTTFLFAPYHLFPWSSKCLNMAALPGIKYDDGSGAYVSNCFPVRSIGEEGTVVLHFYFSPKWHD